MNPKFKSNTEKGSFQRNFSDLDLRPKRIITNSMKSIRPHPPLSGQRKPEVPPLSLRKAPEFYSERSIDIASTTLDPTPKTSTSKMSAKSLRFPALIKSMTNNIPSMLSPHKSPEKVRIDLFEGLNKSENVHFLKELKQN
jgi:hypothetical protein